MPPTITPRGQEAKDRIAQFRSARDAGATTSQARESARTGSSFVPNSQVGSITANDLANPRENPPVTPVAEPTIPGRVDSTVNNVLGSIRSQSETAKKLAEEQASFQNFADESSGFDIQNQQLERFGVTPEKLAELEDIQLQLADRATASGLNKVEIESGGQGVFQGQRSLTQEDREEAVRSAGLASRAAVLQGNIETGRQLAKDAVDIALQDRTFQANAQLQAISDLKDVVDEETRQLLEAESRTYEAELAQIEELKTNIANAMVSGASQSEIAQLNNPNIDDETKLALAQSITARGANEIRNLEIEGLRASNAASWALANERNNVEPGSTFNSPIGPIQIPTFEEWADENGGRLWSIGGTEEEISGLRQEFDDEIEVMQQAAKVAGLSPLAREVVNNPQAYYDFTATQKGEIFEELSKAGLDTNNIISGKKRPLPATQVTEITQAQGVKEDVQKLYEKLNSLPGTGPIGGRLQALDPWNAKRVEIDALITSIVPGLARGIFNEVGVLTDTDVERYKNTLANPNMTDEQIELLHNQTMSKIEQSLNLGLNNYSLAGYAVDKFIEEPLPEPSETGGTEEDPLGLEI